MTDTPFIRTVLAAWLLGLVGACTNPAGNGATLSIVNATLIDGTGAPPRAQVTVVIADGRIVNIRSGERRIARARGAWVDATGKFLIPGLCDAHAHLVTREGFLPLCIANGVTSVRDTGNRLDKLRAWRADIEAGRLLGPRLIFCGPIVDGPHSVVGDLALTVSTAEEGRRSVRDMQRNGADFIKVYNFLSPEAFRAIADEAQRAGVPMAGHVPISTSAGEAAEAGQSCIEHLSGVLLACSSDEDRLRAAIVREIEASEYSPLVTNRLLFSAPPIDLVDTYSPDRAAVLFQRFVELGTRHVPTLVVLRNIADQETGRIQADARLRYLPARIRDDWRRPRFAGRSVDEIIACQAVYRKHMELVGQMHRAGVAILAGTDTPNWVLPGFGLHEELELLVEAGLTPMEALRSATALPAEFLRRPDLGTIAVGQLADMVLLDADPLADIRNTQTIRAVIVRGQFLDRDQLDALLAEAERAAGATQSARR